MVRCKSAQKFPKSVFLVDLDRKSKLGYTDLWTRFLLFFLVFRLRKDSRWGCSKESFGLSCCVDDGRTGSRSFLSAHLRLVELWKGCFLNVILMFAWQDFFTSYTSNFVFRFFLNITFFRWRYPDAFHIHMSMRKIH